VRLSPGDLVLLTTCAVGSAGALPRRNTIVLRRRLLDEYRASLEGAWDAKGRLSVRTCHEGDQIRLVLALGHRAVRTLEAADRDRRLREGRLALDP